MNIEEMRQKPHVSFSQIQTYLSCSLKYKFSYIDKVKPDFHPLSFVFGSSIHKVLAEYYQNLLEGNPSTLESLQNSFALLLESAKKTEKILFDDDTSESVIEKGKALIQCFHKNVSPGVVIAIEQPFTIEIGGKIPPLIGAIDLIEMDKNGNIIVVDHKTSSSKYAQNKIKKDIQMTLYSIATQINGFSRQTPKLRFDVLVKTKTPQFQSCLTVRNEKDQMRALRIIKEVWRAIENEIFVPQDSSNFCTSCQYQSYCEAWR